MKLIAIMVAIASVGMAGAPKGSTGESVTVYIDDKASVNWVLENQARALASRMFNEIGVTIDWRRGRPAVGETGAIGIEFVTNTPEAKFPGCLAIALPIEGIHIQIFWDRTKGFSSTGEVLGHVMVHEITHILEGIPRHSDHGLMKAHWTRVDYGDMRSKPLPFADDDVILIRLGMKARNRRMLAALTPNRSEAIPVADEITVAAAINR